MVADTLCGRSGVGKNSENDYENEKKSQVPDWKTILWKNECVLSLMSSAMAREADDCGEKICHY